MEIILLVLSAFLSLLGYSQAYSMYPANERPGLYKSALGGGILVVLGILSLACLFSIPISYGYNHSRIFIPIIGTIIGCLIWFLLSVILYVERSQGKQILNVFIVLMVDSAFTPIFSILALAGCIILLF